MGIDVYWKDERGEVLGTVEDSGALSNLSNLLHRQSGGACLRFVDPAGDTCFNQLQLPALVTEMRGLLLVISEARNREHLHAVLGLVEGAVRPHTYIWFVGD